MKEAHPEAETQVSVKPMDSNGNAMRNGGNYLDGIALDSDGNPLLKSIKRVKLQHTHLIKRLMDLIQEL